MVCTWVADLVEHLLANSAKRNEPVGAWRLLHRENAVGQDLNNGVADVDPGLHRLVISEEPTAALGAAFHEVPCQCALGEEVVVRGLPAELVDERPHNHGGIVDAAGDDHLAALAKCFSHRESAQICVATHEILLGRQVLAAEHLLRASRPELLLPWHQVIAQHNANLQVDPLLLCVFQHLVAAGLWVEPTGVHDDLHALALDLLHVVRHHEDKVCRVPPGWILLLLPRQDGHRHLCE
mmetsp:Transcript_55740/g.129821  ORF Transcript_55740/g.129821 Transcript_55740/m.129821 type:complete len:238 (-) Transcript_55740:91-804(-)